MTPLCPKLLEELTAFADLGTGGVESRQTPRGWPRVLEVLNDHGFVRSEQKGVSGRQSRFVHIKQGLRILANHPGDGKVRALYAALAAAAIKE